MFTFSTSLRPLEGHWKAMKDWYTQYGSSGIVLTSSGRGKVEWAGLRSDKKKEIDQSFYPCSNGSLFYVFTFLTSLRPLKGHWKAINGRYTQYGSFGIVLTTSRRGKVEWAGLRCDKKKEIDETFFPFSNWSLFYVCTFSTSLRPLKGHCKAMPRWYTLYGSSGIVLTSNGRGKVKLAGLRSDKHRCS